MAEDNERLQSKRKKSICEAQSLGWLPKQDHPYAHMSLDDDCNIQTGIGLIHNEYPDGGKVDIGTINVEQGKTGSGSNTRHGVRADTQMFNATTGDGGKIGADGGVFGANYEASWGNDGATLGAGAYIIQGATRLGEINKNKTNDEQLRLGVGYGPGIGGRLHWGDKDKDGFPEYGFGFDVGPISMDLKTEDPLRTLLKIQPLGINKETNLTSSATKSVKGIVNDWREMRDRQGGFSATAADMGNYLWNGISGQGGINSTLNMGTAIASQVTRSVVGENGLGIIPKVGETIGDKMFDWLHKSDEQKKK